MKTFKFEAYTITETEFDCDLHCLVFTNTEGECFGTIYPATVQDMNDCINLLESGSDPIADSWEDGCGNTCALTGFGA